MQRALGLRTVFQNRAGDRTDSTSRAFGVIPARPHARTPARLSDLSDFPAPPHSDPVREFGAFTRDLQAIATWLASCGVTKVAMESTSVYWIAVYETLERAGFEVMLVPPRMTKQIGGRKSDVLDCQWIWQLMSYGLLRGAFRPGDEVCPLRSYARQMRRLTGDRSRCVLHMHKALTEMNVKLDSVIANITGLTGQRILRAIIGGERDPERLATLRHRGIKADADTIAASLQGTWREEHLFALEQAMQRYDFLTQQIDDCEARVMAEIERLTPPDDLPDGGAPDPAPGTTSETASSRSANAASNYTGKEGIQALALRGMMGVDLTAIPTIGPGTALVIASEIGPDFSAFPSAQHFCSWLALAPGTRISGGKNLPGKSPEGGQPRRAGPAHGGHGRAPQRDLHRRQAPRKARPNGHPRCDQGDRPRTRLPDLPHGDRRPGIRRAGHRRPREAAPQQEVRSSRPPSPKARVPTRPENARRGKTEPNAVNRLGICYSRACFVDPSQSSKINTLPRRSAPNPRAEQHSAANSYLGACAAERFWAPSDTIGSSKE